MIEAQRKVQSSEQEGFTLVEVVLTLVLVVLTVYTLQSTLQTAVKGQRTNEEISRIWGMARGYLDRIKGIPFGLSSDPTPSASMLDELFDDDQDLGNITLHQVSVPFDAAGHTFGVSKDGIVGFWRVKISNDLNQDGDISDEREGRDDLLGIEIYFDNTLQISSMRAANPAFTQIDVGAVYK